MSFDPASEAARRVRGTLRADDKPGRIYRHAVAAAREALAPIRELHTPVHQCCDECGGFQVCAECESWWPCPTARLAYREDEL